MAWRDNLRPASFRGVPFNVDTASGKFGRRLALHEYPQRDTPYAEDMGRKARRHSISAFVLGDDYIAQRDRLLAALEEYGPGQLVHPTMGSLTISVEEVGTSESAADGGYCRFDIGFVESGQRQFPNSAPDTQGILSRRSTALDTAARNRFARRFDLRGPDFLRGNALNRFSPALDRLANLGRLLPGQTGASYQRSLRSVPGLIQSGGGGEAIGAAISGLFDTLGGSGLGRSLLPGLKGLGQYAPYALPAPALTPSRARDLGNLGAVDSLLRNLSYASEARAASDISWATHDDAIAWRDDFSARAQAEASLIGDDQTYLALTDLSRSVRSDIDSRALLLPRLRSIDQPVPVPAAVLAYRLYGVDGDADSIAARNGQLHAGFLPQGSLLTVAPARRESWQ